ncbi:MAG: hypothetical protein RKO66_09040 [Candidatus Contendobacter sp.]|nr:hypothetical protein [Candidatus Contendobacter sp.]MDS4059795.1 hypothetical protein [Candidatus Contendobacter sp.]
MSIQGLDHDEIRAWLERALRGQESLPLLTRDEFPHLGIVRLEKTLKPATRDSLRDGALQLVRQFCMDGRGETAYVQELLTLAAAFKQPEAVQMLARLADKFSDLPDISTEIQLAVLAALVDMPPPQSVEFWVRIFNRDPEKYAGLALSGVLAINPARAIELLPKMPDTERAGQATALKLDLTWDDLRPEQRYRFVEDIRAVLVQCGSYFAGPVEAWVNSKSKVIIGRVKTNESLESLGTALKKYLGEEFSPKVRTPKLCPDFCLAA